ncbi:MAG: ABC transporter ATP-binding protein [Anaerolineae bacterium]|nr:ABC transporter ATP-binding protein [Anaerolineae bacterium]
MTHSLKRYWILLSSYLQPQWPSVLLLAVLLLGQIGLQLVNPQIIRRFIDMVGTGRSLEELANAALLFIGLAVAGQLLALGAVAVGENVAWTATNALRFDLTLHCLKLDMSFHKAHAPGELIERIDGDVNALANFFSQMAIHLIASALLAAGILVLLFRENWRTGAIGFGYALLTVTILSAVQKSVTKAWADSRQAEAEWVGFTGERLAGTEDIRASGAESFVMSQYYRLMRNISRAWLKAKTVQASSANAGAAVYLFTQIAILAVGAWLFLRDQMTIGTVYLAIHYVGQLKGPLDTIRRQVDDLQRASANIERVEALLNTRSPMVENPRAELPGGPLAVAFDRVCFQYNDTLQTDMASSALQEVTFKLHPGQVLGLLGRTGSGKTTLTRLLFRLYDPTQGKISLDGIDLVDTGLSDLRQRIGLVTQDVQLFRASVRDNLTLFNKRFSDEQLLNAFRELELGEWVQSLPQGLDTMLQTGGKSLSAGQAQLLAFARVLLQDPGLVILDEASSRLDPATEQLLERAISRLLDKRTAIIVAHRLSTVQRADQIMILGKGRIIEYGQRAALANDPNSHFYNLLRTGMGEALA